ATCTWCPSGNGSPKTTQSGANGSYSLANLPLGLYNIAIAPTSALSGATFPVAVGGAGPFTQDFALTSVTPTTATLNVTVNGPGNTPVPNATVTVSCGGCTPPVTNKAANSATGGVYTFT